MSVVLKKPETGRVDDSRQPLARAIDAARQATLALTAQRNAVERAEELVEETEGMIAKAMAAARKAEEHDIEAAAQSIHDGHVGAPGTTRKAQQLRQDDLAGSLVLARGVLEKLKAQLPDKELAVALAANAVFCARNLLLAPVAAAALERIKALRDFSCRARMNALDLI
jgi:hypothetical protein